MIHGQPIVFFFFFFSYFGLWAWLSGYYITQKRDILGSIMFGIGVLQIVLLVLFIS